MMSQEIERTSRPRRLTAIARLQILLKQKAVLEARINATEAAARTKGRKDDTRLKIIVGGALLADASVRSDTRKTLIAVLNRGVTSPRDREFLARMGFGVSGQATPPAPDPFVCWTEEKRNCATPRR